MDYTDRVLAISSHTFTSVSRKLICSDSLIVGVSMVQIWRMWMIMCQHIVLVWVGMAAVHQRRIFQMRVIMVFVWVRVFVDMLGWFVNMMMVMILT